MFMGPKIIYKNERKEHNTESLGRSGSSPQ